MVNQAMASYYFPNDSPLGKRLGLGGLQDSGQTEIIGVVRDSKYDNLREETKRVVYLPFLQDELSGMTHYCQPMVALIPARMGSKRVPGKNTRPLNGHPLIAYTIAAAAQSGVFSEVVVCSDSANLALEAGDYGATGFVIREPAADTQPDIVWVKQALRGMNADAFAILRPTSPFRTVATIQRAYRQFMQCGDCVDSIRAVCPVTEHPYKMWVSIGPVGYEAAYPMKPLREGYHQDGTPWHSSPTQSLPMIYVQTSALEMAWTRCVEVYGTISGRKISPFVTTGAESVSIDTEDDWAQAERLARERPDLLPGVGLAGLPTAAQIQ